MRELAMSPPPPADTQRSLSVLWWAVPAAALAALVLLRTRTDAPHGHHHNHHVAHDSAHEARPSHAMTFHWSYHVSLLSDSLHVSTPGGLAAACVAVFLFSASVTMMRTRWPRPAQTAEGGSHWRAAAAHAGLTAASYAVMLLAMTFNIAIFGAVVAGAGVGYGAALSALPQQRGDVQVAEC
eukprot:TRINITY_DN26998_c0_g1_i2.p2 TRINITY_DN26998_c0_g1~~TRINITY_DN26998_c0_g1_i2.p2  ORF type:complete len:182 (+),score=39.06 TRINITY_DN26998_c0_g1_i2:63-608(+)